MPVTVPEPSAARRLRGIEDAFTAAGQPAPVVLAATELLGPQRLWPGEPRPGPALPPERAAELATGRVLARRALELLGRPPAPVGRGTDGEPIWPGGAVGSIAHADGVVLAVVAPDLGAGLGIDVQRTGAVSERIGHELLVPGGALAPPGNWPTVAFCVAEACHKAQHRFTGARLDLGTIRVVAPRAAGRVEVVGRSPALRDLTFAAFAHLVTPPGGGPAHVVAGAVVTERRPAVAARRGRAR